EALSPPAAYNRGLAAAQSEVVVFLDDDNLLLPDGLQKFATALQNTNLDVVVSALDLFEGDDGKAPEPSIGRMIFLGSAHSAGLFSNASGDPAWAPGGDPSAPRGVFFHELGFSYPRFVGVSLANPQAGGLRMGAWQSPALRSRHNAQHAALQPDKL